jgi:hypothetical protein
MVASAKEAAMPEKETLERAKRDLQQGKSPTTAAGEFVREEMEHVKEGKHGAKNRKQAIAIGLSKARRSGVPLGSPRGASRKTKQSARSASRRGKTGSLSRVKRGSKGRVSAKRSAAGRKGGRAAARSPRARRARNAKVR